MADLTPIWWLFPLSWKYINTYQMFKMMRWSKIIFPWREMKTMGWAVSQDSHSVQLQGPRAPWLLMDPAVCCPSAGAQASLSTGCLIPALLHGPCSVPLSLAALGADGTATHASCSWYFSFPLWLKRYRSYRPTFKARPPANPAQTLNTGSLEQDWLSDVHLQPKKPSTFWASPQRWFSPSVLLLWDPPGILHPGLGPPT